MPTLTRTLPAPGTKQARNRLHIVPLHAAVSELGARHLDAAAAAAARGGSAARMLLLTHPTNPTGELYSRPQLEELLRWCLANSVHLVRWAWWAAARPSALRARACGGGAPLCVGVGLAAGPLALGPRFLATA